MADLSSFLSTFQIYLLRSIRKVCVRCLSYAENSTSKPKWVFFFLPRSALWFLVIQLISRKLTLHTHKVIWSRNSGSVELDVKLFINWWIFLTSAIKGNFFWLKGGYMMLRQIFFPSGFILGLYFKNAFLRIVPHISIEPLIFFPFLFWFGFCAGKDHFKERYQVFCPKRIACRGKKKICLQVYASATKCPWGILEGSDSSWVSCWMDSFHFGNAERRLQIEKTQVPHVTVISLISKSSLYCHKSIFSHFYEITHINQHMFTQ